MPSIHLKLSELIVFKSQNVFSSNLETELSASTGSLVYQHSKPKSRLCVNWIQMEGDPTWCTSRLELNQITCHYSVRHREWLPLSLKLPAKTCKQKATNANRWACTSAQHVFECQFVMASQTVRGITAITKQYKENPVTMGCPGYQQSP